MMTIHFFNKSASGTRFWLGGKDGKGLQQVCPIGFFGVAWLYMPITAVPRPALPQIIC